MNNKKQLLLSIGLVLILVLMIVGISYAAFKFVGEGKKLNTITTGAITMEYEESTNTISMTGALPTTDATGKVRLTEGEYFDFTIKSSIKGNTNINWEIAAEDITASSAKKMDGKNIKFYLTKLDSAGAEEEVMAPKVYSATTSANTKTGRPSGVMSLATGTMSTSETTNYRLRMYVDEDYNPQGDGGGLSFSVKINAYGKVKEGPTGSKMKAYMTQADEIPPETDFHTDAYMSKITSIITKKDNIVPETATESWDISEAQDGSVMAYVEKTDEVLEPLPTNAKIYSNDDEVEDISKTIYATPLSETNVDYAYKLTIGGKDGIIANENMTGYFTEFFSGNDFSNDASIDLSALDTSEVTNMQGMFAGCSSLTSLDVSSFDTSKVTDMSAMFDRCGGLTSLDVSNFNTSKVTNMSNMFRECSSLTSLDLSKFDTSKVTNMSNMFFLCDDLKSLDLSGFDTSKVTNMSNMFSMEYSFGSLTSLDLSSFDTSKVTDMSAMFERCSGLTSLDLSSFDTSKVTNMSSMFSDCSSLTSLNVSSFDTSKVTNMSSMFSGCRSLTSLNVSSFDTSQVTDMDSMFSDCRSLTNLDLSSFDTSNVTNMSSMFYDCSSLTSLDVSNFNTSKVTNMSNMFRECSSLTGLDVSKFDTSKVTNMSLMFYGCSRLTSLDLSGFDTSNVTDMYGMFKSCSRLTSLDLRSFDISKVTDMRCMFQSCSKLTQITVSNKWVIKSGVSTTGMFSNCGTDHVTVV